MAPGYESPLSAEGTGPATTMNNPLISDGRDERLAKAVLVGEAALYEGYVLYPYRASALKNSMRWQFGVVAPAEGCAAEVVLGEWSPDARVEVTVRFLRPCPREPDAAGWDDAIDETWRLETVCVGDLMTSGSHVVRAAFGTVELHATLSARHVDRCLIVRLVVDNRTQPTTASPRIHPAPGSIVGVHAMFALDSGSFVSVIDPLPAARAAVEQARSDGLHPVLIGSLTASDVVLALPIILYDDPAVAPESSRPLYDATEIDELLSLRVLTLTDEEKREARATDPRAAAIVDHVMGLAPDSWSSLHGTERAPDGSAVEQVDWLSPATEARFDPFSTAVEVGGVSVAAGSHVTLRPRSNDAHDMFLSGRAATVRGVFTDLSGATMIAVTIDDDPAAELNAQTGRFRFFRPDEVTPVAAGID